MAISLEKGQTISLAKTAGTTLSEVQMGLGWDGIVKKGMFGMGSKRVSVDLDANALLFDERGNMTDTVWFRQLQSKDGSVRHSGDNRTGEGEGDDETITVSLTRLPSSVVTVIFSVNNYSGSNFGEVDNAYCRLVNTQGGAELARYNLSAQGGHSALILASLKRQGGDWVMTAIGKTSAGRTFHDNLSDIRPHL